MGNATSNRCRPQMRIHSLHGKYLRLSEDRLSASRVEGYADAMFFGSRTVDREEQLELELTKMTQDWNGSLRFGFTSINPVDICNHPEGIPRFMCPDLIKRGGSFIETLNHIKLRVGDRIVFWVNAGGEVQVKINEVVQRPQVTKLVTREVWPAVDVYGNTVALKFRSLKDKITSGPIVEPHCYTLLNLIKFPVAVNSESLDCINREIIRRKSQKKAFAWNANPLPVNSVWVLFVKEVDYLASRELSLVFLTSCPAINNIIPETLEGFSRSGVFKNVYERMTQGDELAICVTDAGAVLAAINGLPFESIGSVPKSSSYWIVCDMNCDILSLESLGVFQMTKYPLPKLPKITENFAPRPVALVSESSFEERRESPRGAASAVFELPQPIPEVINLPPPEVVPVIIIPPNNDSECVICLNNVPDSVFIPCGHICCCKACADNLMNEHGNLFCPTCRKKIDKNIKVNF